MKKTALTASYNPAEPNAVGPRACLTLQIMAKEKATASGTLAAIFGLHVSSVQTCLQAMKRRELVSVDPLGWKLTPKGRALARQLGKLPALPAKFGVVRNSL